MVLTGLIYHQRSNLWMVAGLYLHGWVTQHLLPATSFMFYEELFLSLQWLYVYLADPVGKEQHSISVKLWAFCTMFGISHCQNIFLILKICDNQRKCVWNFGIYGVQCSASLPSWCIERVWLFHLKGEKPSCWILGVICMGTFPTTSCGYLAIVVGGKIYFDQILHKCVWIW